MEMACEEAYKGIKDGDGGPFGAVIVLNGKVIGSGHNTVIKDKDPTMHGEIAAIRNACKNIKSFSLEGAEIYTTAEPCPMCLGAILWADISRVYYGCNRHDTESIGFRDNAFYNIIGNDQTICQEFDREKCLELFNQYMKNKDRKSY
ncbi:MAG: nucleoside deaminase [Clostridiales bacterium]|nr:nucleoside deaminase [Clostridiales bacterium]